MLRQAKVVSVVPDLGDLAVLEPVDVDGRKGGMASRRFQGAPRTEMRAGGCPAADDIVLLADDQVDGDSEIREGRTEVVGDSLLTLWPLLGYLSTLGLMPGASVELVSAAPFDGPLVVNIDGVEAAIAADLAALVGVAP